MESDGLENQMLYELNTLHEWSEKFEPTTQSVINLTKVISRSVYNWSNWNLCYKFILNSIYPEVSFDGEYVAYSTGSKVDIRNKSSFTDIFSQVETGSVFLMKWSENSLHLLVCNSNYDLIILDINGNKVISLNSTGLVITQITFSKQQHGFTATVLSKNGYLITTLEFDYQSSITQSKSYEYENSVGQFYFLSPTNQLLTLQILTSGICFSLWNLPKDKNDEIELFNSCHFKTEKKFVENIIVDYPGVICRVEKTSQKYFAIMENSSKTISVYYLPSLSTAKTIRLPKVKDVFIKEHVVDIDWWSTEVIAILSSSGSVSLLSFKNLDIFEAENFGVPSIFIPAPTNSICIIEQVNGPKPQILSSLSDLMFWRKDSKLDQKVELKLHHLLQTSPELLFYQKIDSQEFGEALLLATKFGLDRNRVYKAQWSLNNQYISSIYDFLYKVTDEEWVMNEIRHFIPPSIDMAQQLVDYGLSLTQKKLTNPAEDNKEEEEDSIGTSGTDITRQAPSTSPSSTPCNYSEFQTYFRNCKVVLMLYDEILSSDDTIDYEGDLFKRMCSRSLVISALEFANKGNWIALDVLFTKAEVRMALEDYWLLLLAHLPETLDPKEYQDILPEFVSAAKLRYAVSVSEPLSSWYEFDGTVTEVGLWEEAPLEDMPCSVSDLPCFAQPEHINVPFDYKSVCGPLTTEKVFQWYAIRCNEIVQTSGLFQNAVDLLSLGLEKNVPLSLHKNTLSFMENLTFSLGLKDISVGDVHDDVFDKLMYRFLRDVSVADHVDYIIDVFLPFFKDLEVTNEDVVEMVLSHVKAISKESLLPVIQTLEFKSEDFSILSPASMLNFAQECLSTCTSTNSWLPTAKDIGEILRNKLFKDKLEFGEHLITYLNDVSPSLLFKCFSDENTCNDVIRKLTQECLKNHQTKPLYHVAFLINCEAFTSTSIFNERSYLDIQVIFEECFQLAEVAMMQELCENFKDRYLNTDVWNDFLDQFINVYFNSAVDIDDKYIELVRYLLLTDVQRQQNHIHTKIQVLDILKALGVVITPRNVHDERKELIRHAVLHFNDNYLKLEMLRDLTIKLDIEPDYIYGIVGDIAYGESNFKYCKQVLQRAIDEGCKDSIVQCGRRLLKNTEFNDFEFKEELFLFLIKHIQPDQVDEIMEVYHSLPSYVDSRKRKLSEVCDEKRTDMKILKIATSTRDIEDEIMDIDNLEELYTWLLGRSLAVTNTNIDKAPSLPRVIGKAMETNTPDIRMLSNKISDILQANILKDTYENINVPRFIYDAAYRRDTIMKLAERESIDLALSLGRKYGIEVYDIYFRHYQWWIINGGGAKGAPTCGPMCEFLLADNKSRFIESCHNVLFPKLDGKKHNTLLVYYQKLRDAGWADSSKHITTLTKIRDAVPGLDYKALQVSTEPLALLEPLLSDGNVHVVGKMAPNLSLTSSNIFKAYCLKLFWKGEGKSQQQSYQQRWTRLERYLPQLDQNDRTDFLESICCSPSPGVPYKLRADISDTPSTTALHSHITNLEEIFDSIKSTFLLPAYLMCYHDKENAGKITTDSILSVAFHPELYGQLDPVIRVFGADCTPQKVIDSCLSYLISRMSKTEGSEMVVIDGLIELYWFREVESMRLLEELIERSGSAGSMLSQGDVIQSVKHVCSEPSLMPSLVNALVTVLEKYLNSEDDTEMVTYYKTNALVSSQWSINIQLTDILQVELLSKLCEGSTSPAHFRALVEIIRLWWLVRPNHEWVLVVLRQLAKSELSESEGSTVICDLMSIQDKTLSPHQVKEVADAFQTPSLSYLIILSSPHLDLYYDITTELKTRDLDNEQLLDKIISRELYLELLGTNLWSIIVKRIIDHKDMAFVFQVAKVLRDMGYNLESASLVAQFTASSYTTFSAYRALLARA